MGNSIDHGMFRKSVLLAFGLSISFSGFALAASEEPVPEQQAQAVEGARKINPAAVEVLLANIRELRNKTLELEASLRRYNESLRYYTSSALKEADELTKAANLQLQQSETGIAEYIQSITTAREIRRGYIETVYQYNIAALEYELFK